MRAVIVGLMCLSLSLVSTSALGAPDVRGPLILRSAPVRTDGIRSMPQVVPNAAATPIAAARINAAGRREDERTIDSAAACMAQQERPRVGAWRRAVTATMAGPAYLSLVTSDSYYCGGPYPNDGLRTSFVYDLKTGRPVDWLALFPPGAAAKADMSPNGAQLGLVVWRPFTQAVLEQAVSDCEAVFDPWDRFGFSVYLDARSGELVAFPSGLPHAVQACAEEVRLPLAQLRRMGFKPELTAALAAARRLQQPR